MKRKMLAAGLLIAGFLGLLVAKGITQPLSSSSPQPTPAPNVSSQVGPNQTLHSPPAALLPATSVGQAKPNFAAVGHDGALKIPAQEMTFEQLAEELRRVRYRQKELKEQEADLLDKMTQKVEEKRKDYNKAQEELRQMQGNLSHPASSPGAKMDSTSDAGNRLKPIQPK